MKKLKGFLEDNEGGFSCTRLAFLLWAVAILAVWLGSFFKSGTLTEIPGSVLTLLGILTGGKVVQRFGESTDSLSQPLAVAGTGIPIRPTPASPQPVV